MYVLWCRLIAHLPRGDLLSYWATSSRWCWERTAAPRQPPLPLRVH